ncbi:TRAP transporter substrate-binding protein [Telmatospirillum sp. J64-1]|uniref:TRAP transporter substrate-binding protein n=1 Tax=Telmatospirillum sp. J64-1 TaxID=2502183 RepID=UPI0021030EF4|nr:TRAP transporter substrate-binding protein [Telmatospirillum sp. J64-1]
MFRGIRRTIAVAGLLGLPLMGMTPASAQEIELRFGHNIAVGTPTDLGAKRFAELVEERSGGTIRVLTYPGGQLGNEQQMIEGLQIGTLDMAAIAGATYGNVIPEANILGLLYAFRDTEHMQKSMRGEPGRMIADALRERLNIHMIEGAWYYGTRHLTSNRPVETPDDMAGMKLRIVPVPIFEAGWRAVGATPTPVDFKELFTALQTNTVDAQENPLPIIDSVGVPLVNKYLTLTGHVVANEILAMSDDTYNRLTPEQREILVQAARDAGEYRDQLTIESEEALLKKFEDSGMTIITPDKEAFRAKVADVPNTFQRGQLADIYAKIQAVE